jgi:hypothetical protein
MLHRTVGGHRNDSMRSSSLHRSSRRTNESTDCTVRDTIVHHLLHPIYFIFTRVRLGLNDDQAAATLSGLRFSGLVAPRTAKGERQVGETNECRSAAPGSTFVLLRDKTKLGHGR